jgi:hypothetical protein
MRGGYHSERDAAGGVTCPGWVECQLPSAQKAREGRSYAELKARAGK